MPKRDQRLLVADIRTALGRVMEFTGSSLSTVGGR